MRTSKHEPSAQSGTATRQPDEVGAGPGQPEVTGRAGGEARDGHRDDERAHGARNGGDGGTPRLHRLPKVNGRGRPVLSLAGIIGALPLLVEDVLHRRRGGVRPARRPWAARRDGGSAAEARLQRRTFATYCLVSSNSPRERTEPRPW